MAWEDTKIVGYIWHCGDEFCDCSQARIERLTPNRKCGPPRIRRVLLWSGTFYCDSGYSPWKEDGSPSPDEELRAHLEEFHATLIE